MTQEKDIEKIEAKIKSRRFKYAQLSNQVDIENIKHAHFKKQKKLNNLRNALILSLFSIIMCLICLTSVTYAWFTTTISNSNNIIQTGIVDVELLAEKNGQIIDLTTSTNKIFNVNDLSPSKLETETIKLTIKNKGNLPIKYKLYFSITPNEVSENELSGYLDVFLDNKTISEGKLNSFSETNPLIKSEELNALESESYYVKIKLDPASTSNKTTSFDIKLSAYQLTQHD